MRWTSTTAFVVTAAGVAFAADCKFATVQSGGNCFSIAQAAGITTDQLLSFNPGLDCSLLAIGKYNLAPESSSP